MIVASLSNLGGHFGVGDVCAVPRHEEVDTVGGGNGNVKRVPRGFRRERPDSIKSRAGANGILRGLSWQRLWNTRTTRARAFPDKYPARQPRGRQGEAPWWLWRAS